jgi:hypothetical protein
MNGFQLIGIALLAALSLLTLAAAVRRRLTTPAAAAWIALWLTAAVAIARPGITIVVANFLGIGRGADLVMYCAILAGIAGFFAVFLRLRRLDHELTLVVRQLALLEVRRPPEEPQR